MNNYLGDIISIFICLWFIKTYLLHYRMTKEEAFIVREAPKVFLYPLTILVCIMLILVPLSERGLVPGVVPDSILKYTLVSFMLWITLVLECYAKTGQGWDKNLDSLCSILESELKTLDATFRFHTGGSLMKYTKKERMNIGRQIYEDQINKYEAAGKYGISAQTAREYMRMYRNTNHLPPKTSKPRDYGLAKAKVIPEAAKLDEYQKMSKEDLISALIDARIREERLKLGYEVVEEDDSKKKLITYVKKTAK